VSRGESEGRSLVLQLLAAAEGLYDQVTPERFRRLAREELGQGYAPETFQRVLREAQAAGMILTDRRLRLTRSGEVRPVRLLRLNYRHPAVITALQVQDDQD
jgi:hypothetical protein